MCLTHLNPMTLFFTCFNNKENNYDKKLDQISNIFYLSSLVHVFQACNNLLSNDILKEQLSNSLILITQMPYIS